MDFLIDQDVYDYLGIDYPDEMVARRVRSLIAAVDAYLVGAIGRDYAIAVGPESLAKAKEVGLMLIVELYENDASSAKERSTIRNLLSSMLLQLQLDFEESRYC